ncbi:hypothetical protein U879_13195 [Defluviimonas sp. 20V17]|jgi:hypothetical protein|uniref:Uncharacterized protein n=1 Tax=Allgaiera indica TaxID=765699 RepID=A0AAN4UQL9_9RHOB|nr:hypothetical protein [Allgaiera indica]KDB03206.1 hypothetical protein U879_13195 [Defluviimonas sp. 20V17]MDP7150269.1 hypothetical protein [Paracoccaceae bacterium]GHE01070.1 hypothetical protein GCM10008024_15250 [Allgaiera indica]SDW77539.1 hypothetical protein SAMN05444006_106214 [Allgaiera indica]
MTDRASSPEDDALRARIGDMLASGLETEVWPRAETSEMVNQIVGRLRTEAAGDLEKKLVIGGFTDHTITAEDMEQPCETCMYYLIHRKYCELPELDVPVEPHWSCRLWRI